MGLIDFINKFKKMKMDIKYAKILNGYSPIFSQFGQDIYASDVVQQAISCLVTELTKVNPFHIKKNGSDLVPIEDSEIQRLLEQPNERMTQTDFFEKVYWQLFLNYNAFIIHTIRMQKETKNILVFIQYNQLMLLSYKIHQVVCLLDFHL